MGRRNFNRRPKDILAKHAAPQAARYSAHAFRLGSAQGMNATGSRLSAIASAGTWRSDAVNGYVHLAANARQLFRFDMDSESEKEVLPNLRAKD